MANIFSEGVFSGLLLLTLNNPSFCRIVFIAAVEDVETTLPYWNADSVVSGCYQASTKMFL